MPDPAFKEKVEAFYRLESRGALDQLPGEVRGSFERLRDRGVLPAPDALADWDGTLAIKIPPPAAPATSTTVTPTTSHLPPGTQIPGQTSYSPIGGLVGGAAAPAALTAGLRALSMAPHPAAKAIGMIGSALLGAGLGGAATEGVQAATQSVPSRVGTIPERMGAAGGEELKGEGIGQVLGAPFRLIAPALRAARGLTSTSRAVGHAASSGMEQLAGAKAIQEAEVLGPRVRRLAEEAATPAKTALKAGGKAAKARAAGAPDPLLDAAARSARARVVDPLGRIRSPQELLSTLRPIMRESPIDVVAKAAGNKDLARALLHAAEKSPDPAKATQLVRHFIDAASTGAEVGTKLGAAPPGPNQTLRRIARFVPAMAGLGGSYFYGPQAAVMGAFGAMAAPLAQDLLERALNNKTAGRFAELLSSEVGQVPARVLGRTAEEALRPTPAARR